MTHNELICYIQGVLDAHRKIKIEVGKTTKIEDLESGEICERLIEKAIEKYRENPSPRA